METKKGDETMEMKVGTRIYYTGDVENNEDEGTIVKVNPPFMHWGETCDIRLDDGRIFRTVFPLAFDASPGRRFWPLDEWLANLATKVLASQRRYMAMIKTC